MSEIEWNDIIAAYKIIQQGKITKIEGINWIMYKVGFLIRLDIREKSNG